MALRNLKSSVQFAIAAIDRLIHEQVNLICNDAKLMKLECSWRQLYDLVIDASSLDSVKIRVIDISWREICKDLESSPDFDGSYLFKLIYSNEYDMPGGEPYGLLVCDYSIGPSRKDLGFLRTIGQIAASAFSPVVLSVKPDFFELDNFNQLQAPIDLDRTFSQDKFAHYKSLRSEPDMRFVGLLLPNILVTRNQKLSQPNYSLSISEQNKPNAYLWGNPCYAFAKVAMRTYHVSGWFASIQGVGPDDDDEVILDNYPHPPLTSDDVFVYRTISTNVFITEKFEKSLNAFGFMVLSECRYAGCHAFFASRSVYCSLGDSATSNKHKDTNNAPPLLNYVMCVSRFAHYIKVIARDKLGSYNDINSYETELYNWILQYTANSSDMSSGLMAKHPLRSASIHIRERKQLPGSYYMVICLQPHFQFEWATGSIKLITDIKNG